jgi:internalin A
MSTKACSMRNKVFISYSHKDKRFFDELLIHLKPLTRDGRVTDWSDEQIQPGAKWFDDIKSAVASAKVAVLLVSKDFLASNFIYEHELSPLLDAAKRGDVQILWVLVRACSYTETVLKDYQALVPPDKPLAEMKTKRDSAWVNICKKIEQAVAANP